MITRWDIHEKLGNARPLNRDTTKMSAAASKTNIICTMSIQPFEIFVRARCVHDEEKLFVANAIRDQVIDDSAAFVQQKSVLALADLQLVDVVGQHRIQPNARIAAIDNQLAHVRNVEHADVLSDGLMFFHNAGVLNRHQPSGERHHLRAASYVLVVKRRLFLRRFGFLGIPGLPRILGGFAALVFRLAWLLPGFTSMLTLDPVRIRHGEVWRLVTYMFIPQCQSPLWVLFALWFLWWIGEGVERAWGSFRLTLYVLVGRIGTIAAAFFFGSNFSNSMLLMSLFLAFAHFYPEEIIYILF